MRRCLSVLLSLLLAVALVPLAPFQRAEAETVTTSTFVSAPSLVFSARGWIQPHNNDGGGYFFIELQADVSGPGGLGSSRDTDDHIPVSGGVTTSAAPAASDSGSYGGSNSWSSSAYEVTGDNSLDTVEVEMSVSFNYSWSRAYLSAGSSVDDYYAAVTSCSVSNVQNRIRVTVNGSPYYDSGNSSDDQLTYTLGNVRSGTSSTATYNPIVTATDLTKNVGSAIPTHNWTQGVTATWGKTTSNSFGPGSTTYGTITSNTAVPTLTAALPNNGSTFTGIGRIQQSVQATDASGDGAYKDATRWITVKSTASPALALTYASGPNTAQPYTPGTWTNESVTATVTPNNIQGSSTNFRTVLNDGAATIGNASQAQKNYTTSSTSAAGTNIWGVLIASGDATELSGRTTAQTVMIDKLAPIPGVTYDPAAGTFTDTSTDTGRGFSGIDDTRIAIVTTGASQPAVGAGDWYDDFADVSVAAPGFYDIWVEATDNAGNVATVKTQTNMLLKSTEAPGIKGSTPTVTDLASGTWVNQDVTVSVMDNPLIGGGNYYLALYKSSSVQEGKASALQTDYQKTYAAETAGTTFYGVAVDASDTELSGRSGDYIVRIDKTVPTAQASYSFAANTFSDQSVDNGSVQSGVDPSKTKIAVVEAGEVPEPGDYTSIASAQRGTDPDTFYDAWIICEDVAGNVSTAARVFENVCGSGTDTMSASDFEYGLNQSTLTDVTAKALAFVEGIYAGAGMTAPNGGIIPTVDFLVDATELSAINTAISNGTKTTLPLTFSTPVNNPNFPAQDTQTSVTVQVTLRGMGDDAVQRIYADDFIWATETGALSVQDAISAAFVTLYDADGLPLAPTDASVDTGDLLAINGAIADRDLSHTWPLTFTSPDASSSVTIQVTLVERVDPPVPPTIDHSSIGANSFALAYDQRALLDGNAARVLSIVRAYDTFGNLVPAAAVAVDPLGTELPAIYAAPTPGPNSYGVYPLTFAHAGKTVTVSVRLFDNGPVPPPFGTEALYANDFFHGCSSGELTEAIAKQLSGVWGIQTTGYPFAASQITADSAQLADIEAHRIAHELGSYPLKFYAGASEVEVQVTLRDNGPVPVVPGRDTLSANDFLYGLDEAQLTEAIVREMSFVQGADRDGNHLPQSAIFADAALLAELIGHFDAGEWGTFDMRYTTQNDGRVNFKVTLQQHGPGPVPPLPGTDHITANDFTYGIDEAALTEAIAKDLAHVFCRDRDGIPVDVSLIGTDAIELAAISAAQAAEATGDYSLTFISPDGNEVAVTVSLVQKGPGPGPLLPGAAHIAANDFSIGCDEPLLDASVARLLSKVGATGTDRLPAVLSAINVDATELAAIQAAQTAGTPDRYKLTFAYDGASVTVKVTVSGHGAGGGGGGGGGGGTASDHITANDFSYGINEADLSADIARFLAHVDGVDKDGNPIDVALITVDAAELAAIVEAQHNGATGDYPLTFTTPDGVEVVITVSLADEGGPAVTPGTPSIPGTPHIAANNFTVGADEPTLSAAVARIYARVVATDADGAPIRRARIEVDATELAAIRAAQANGSVVTLPLTFSLVSGERVTVQVGVRHHGSGVVDDGSSGDPRQTTAHLTGNDFSYGCSEPDLTHDIAGYLGRVSARDASGNILSLSALVVDSLQLAAIVSAQHSAALGDYPLAFIADDGTRLTITVTLHHGGSGGTDPASGTAHITGNNFVWNVSQALLSASIVLSRSEAAAVSKTGVPASSSAITVNAEDLATVVAAQVTMRAAIDYDGQSVDHYVRVSHDGQDHRITVTLVKDPTPRPPITPAKNPTSAEDPAPAIQPVEDPASRSAEPEEDSYAVRYFAGGTNVTGMPTDATDLRSGDTHIMAKAPERKGYSFDGWKGSDNKTYEPGDRYTIDNTSLYLTAVWRSDSSVWGGKSSTAVSSDTSSATPSLSFDEAVVAQGIPVIGVPLVGPEGHAVWALANLLIALFGIALALLFIIRRMTRRDEEGGVSARRPVLFVALGAVLTLVNVLIFVLTQDLSCPAVWFDAWTAAMLIVAVLELAMLLISRYASKSSGPPAQPDEAERSNRASLRGAKPA